MSVSTLEHVCFDTQQHGLQCACALQRFLLQLFTILYMWLGDAPGNAFFGELFVKYSDGFVTTATPRPPPAPGATKYTPGGTATVSVQEPGYDETWYDRIVADAGEKYHVPSQFELVDPRLSTDRLKFL